MSMSSYQSLRLNLLSNKVATGASVAFAARVYGAAVAYLIQIFLARTMGAEELGIYVFAWTTATFVAFLAPLGFDNALVRFLASYHGKNDWAHAKGALQTGFRFTLSIALALSLIAMATIYLLDAKAAPYGPTLLFAFACLPLLALINLNEGIARGFSWVYQVGLPSFAIRPTLFFVGVLVAWAWGVRVSSPVVMAIMVAATILTFAWQHLSYRKLLDEKIQRATAKLRTHYWVSVAAPMVLVVSFEQLLANTDIIMLGLIEGPSATGIYNIAVRIVGIALFVFFAVSAFAAPRIAELYGQKKVGEIVRLSHNVRLAIALPTLVGLLLLIVFANPILSVFGVEFIGARIPLLILCVPIALRAMAGPIDNLLTMTGEQAALSRVLGTTALFNVAANAVLIPLFGIIGAACATSMSIIIELAWTSRLVAKHIGYRSWLPYQ